MQSPPSDATLLLGVTPADHGRVAVWLWSPIASLQQLGLYAPQMVPALAGRLKRNRPDLALFVGRGVAL